MESRILGSRTHELVIASLTSTTITSSHRTHVFTMWQNNLCIKEQRCVRNG